MQHIFEHRAGDKMGRTRSSKSSSSNKVKKTRSESKASSDTILTGEFLFELYDLFDFQHCINSIAPERCSCSDFGNSKRGKGTTKSPVSQTGETVPDNDVNKFTEDEYSVPLDSPCYAGAAEFGMDVLPIPRIQGFVEKDNGVEVHSLDGSINIHEIQTICEQQTSFYKKSRFLWLHELIIGDIYDDW